MDPKVGPALFMKIKKASKTVWEMAAAINPKTPKTISYEEAWEIIAEYWDLLGTLESLKDGITRFNIIYGGQIIKQLGWSNDLVWDTKEGVFDFSQIYKDVLEWLIKSRTIKKSRAARGNKVLDLPKETKKAIKAAKKSNKTDEEEEAEIIEEKPMKDSTESLESLKKLKQRTYNQLNHLRKRGEDTRELEKKFAELSQRIKDARKK